MSSFVVLPADKREPLFVIVDRVKADCLYNHIPFIAMYVILILDCPFNVFLVLTRFPIAGRFVEYPRIGRWGSVYSQLGVMANELEHHALQETDYTRPFIR